MVGGCLDCAGACHLPVGVGETRREWGSNYYDSRVGWAGVICINIEVYPLYYAYRPALNPCADSDDPLSNPRCASISYR